MDATVKRRSAVNNNYERELGDTWTEAKSIYHEEMCLHFDEIRRTITGNLNQTNASNNNTNKLQQTQASVELQEKHKILVAELLKKFHRESGLGFDERRKLRSSLDFQLQKYTDELTLIVNSMSRPVLGIDLGTTYCCVAVYHRGKISIVTNEIGQNTTPSYIAFDGDHSYIGQPAKEQAHMNPENTIFDAKRLIGRKYHEPIVQRDIALWPFEVVLDERNKNGNPKIKVEDRTYFPEEISGRILKTLKKEAENFLGGVEVVDAVITVPAYFNNGQRQATKEAGKLAGLNVLQILNEPTAAAITYSLNRIDRSRRNVLIFDLGGGTFDVSVLTIEEGIIKIRAVGGDTHLGGEDFDNSMVDFCIQEFKNKTGIDIAEGKNSPDLDIKFKACKGLRRLRNECEKQKQALSFATRAVVALDSIHSGEDLKITFTRKMLEDLIEDRLCECIEKVDKVLEDLPGMTKEDVDDIVLVGGSSRIPRVQRLLQDYFEREELVKSMHPDEAVAQGAAIHACLLSEGHESIGLRQSVCISDVIPLSIGVQIRDGEFARVIPKNTSVPFAITKKFVTRYDDQTVMKLPIYEGEDIIAKNNYLLGTIKLENIPQGLAGEEQCEVVMKIDSDGIFTVEATALGNTAIQQGIRISLNTDRPQHDEVDVFPRSDSENNNSIEHMQNLPML